MQSTQHTHKAPLLDFAEGLCTHKLKFPTIPFFVWAAAADITDAQNKTHSI